MARFESARGRQIQQHSAGGDPGCKGCCRAVPDGPTHRGHVERNAGVDLAINGDVRKGIDVRHCRVVCIDNEDINACHSRRARKAQHLQDWRGHHGHTWLARAAAGENHRGDGHGQ